MLHVGVLEGDQIIDVTEMGLRSGIAVPASIDAFIKSGDGHALSEVLETAPVHAAADCVKFAPVLLDPQKIICAGVNYAAHAAETGRNLPEIPVLFAKLNNSLNSHDGEVELIDTAEQYDYEAELVAVIGKRGKFIPEHKAHEHIFGYTCGNDLSAREVQKVTSQFLMGKSFDGMCPIGPCVVTADSIDPSNLPIRSRVNGEVRQSSNTNQLIFSCARLIAYASRYMTLEAGDLFFTGTPGGVIAGYPPEKREWLKKGDIVEVEIDGIGTLLNKMV
jgi:2-keto-4-pentenoate hydratase/2-oxohepta-3-ene-1,7-dioic acid hydratase in catechol pathway